jgi:hypothetical protein
MAEGSETPNGEQGPGPEGRPRRSEGDLLAERRARRAAESGEIALTRRAEAAEATVQTLERHVASLQQRLREAEDERLRMDEILDAERSAVLERENELRRVKQREYAEQQLRVEAEDRLLMLDRDSRVELEALSTRLSASEAGARELALRLDGVQRQLAEAGTHAEGVGQQAAAERAGALAELRSEAERDLKARLSDLERRALEIQRGLDAERAARERSERLLESMRQGNRRMESLLGDMKGIVARVTAALAAERASAERPTIDRSAIGQLEAGQHPPAPSVPGEARGVEMADALAAAVERLRARAECAPPIPDAESAGPTPELAASLGGEESTRASGDEAVAGASVEPAAPVAQLPANKHSLSWIARRRIKRKQRRERRSSASVPPSMQSQ